MPIVRLVTCALVALASLGGVAAAQGTTGSISGFVTDATHAAVPGATGLHPMPKQVDHEQRREQIRETARKHGRQANERQLALAQWTILITNVPAELLSVAEVLVLARARWQIERLFRLWKEGGQIDEWRSKKPWRILCEIYSKLIAQVVQHWCLLLTWQQPDRSLVKAAKVVRSHALQFIEVLMGESSLEQLLRKLQRGMARCRLNRRAKHPNLSQLLLEGLDWPLT